MSDDGSRFIDPLGAGPAPRATDHTGNRPATVALTCGLIGVAIAWMPYIVVAGATLAVLALVFGVKGRRRAATAGSGRGFALVGLISGVAGLLLSIVGVWLSVSVTREVVDFLEPGAVATTVESCEITPGALVVTGTITNDSRSTHDYTVYAVFSSPPDLTDAVLDVLDVAPGETRRLELRRSTVADGECSARLVVHGPTPYGVDVERVND